MPKQVMQKSKKTWYNIIDSLGIYNKLEKTGVI